MAARGSDPSFGKTLKLARQGVVTRTVCERVIQEGQSCRACLQGKSREVSHQRRPDDKWRPDPMDRVHFDIVEPGIVGVIGHRYLLVVIDEHSGYVEAIPLVSKGQAGEQLMLLCARWRNRSSTHAFPRQVLSDNAPEFKEKNWSAFCLQKGIECLYSTPYVPQSNGTAERAVQSVLTALRVAMLHGRFPEHMWPVVVAGAVDQLNLLPTRRHPSSSPFEEFSGGDRPVAQYVIGCEAFVHVKHRRHKLDLRAARGVVLQSNPCRVYLLDKRVVLTTRSVVVCEQVHPFADDDTRNSVPLVWKKGNIDESEGPDNRTVTILPESDDEMPEDEEAVQASSPMAGNPTAGGGTLSHDLEQL